jgi:hypothetical protein
MTISERKYWIKFRSSTAIFSFFLLPLRKESLLRAYDRLVNAPVIEAAEIVDKLSGLQESTIKMTLFSLQKFIRVSSFIVSSLLLTEFIYPLSIGRTIRERVPQTRRSKRTRSRYQYKSRKYISGTLLSLRFASPSKS